MTEDLNMTGDDCNIGLLCFCITYILFEVPSNLVRDTSTSTADIDDSTPADQHDRQRSSNAYGRLSTWRLSWVFPLATTVSLLLCMPDR